MHSCEITSKTGNFYPANSVRRMSAMIAAERGERSSRVFVRHCCGRISQQTVRHRDHFFDGMM
jgi:hypothetical protein